MSNIEINTQLSLEFSSLNQMLFRSSNTGEESSEINEIDLSATDMNEGEEMFSDIAVYQKLTEIEAVIKEKKDLIKKQLMEYMKSNNFTRTPSYENLFATIETRVSYSLDPMLLQMVLPDDVYARVVVKSIDMTKMKKEFVEGNVSASLLKMAEQAKETEAFAVRKENREYKEQKKIPYWHQVEETEEVSQ